jgi:hypothetical protein
MSEVETIMASLPMSVAFTITIGPSVAAYRAYRPADQGKYKVGSRHSDEVQLHIDSIWFDGRHCRRLSKRKRRIYGQGMWISQPQNG